jgi:hypothetical protein
VNMEQHGRYPRPHALTPVCPYMEQNIQQNGIAWHLPSNFRANRATPLFNLSRWSNICTQVRTLFSPTHVEKVEKREPAGKATRAQPPKK